MAWWNELPLVGGLAGSVFGNPESEAHQKALQQARQDMMRYRPDAMNARMNVMGNMSHAFSPINNMLGQMYGQGAMMPIQQTIQNPFPQQMQEGMMQQAFEPQTPEIPDKLGQLGAKVPKQIRERVSAKQKQAGQDARRKAGY